VHPEGGCPRHAPLRSQKRKRNISNSIEFKMNKDFKKGRILGKRKVK
jgi:hypothetical protein